MTQILKGKLVKGPCKPICRDCAIYFSITVICWVSIAVRVPFLVGGVFAPSSRPKF